MKTIKIIDLLNKIAKGKEVPKRIKYMGLIWEYDKEIKDYFDGDLWLFYTLNSNGLLENEVEIIEDTFKYFGKEEKQAVKNIIKKNSIPVKENYNDYYEDTPKEEIQVLSRWYPPKENKRISKVSLLDVITDYKLKDKLNEIIDKINGEE